MTIERFRKFVSSCKELILFLAALISIISGTSIFLNDDGNVLVTSEDKESNIDIIVINARFVFQENDKIYIIDENKNILLFNESMKIETI